MKGTTEEGRGADISQDEVSRREFIQMVGMAGLATSPGAFQSGLVGSTGNAIAAKFTSDGQFVGATYAFVSSTAGAGPLIAVAPNGAIVLAISSSLRAALSGSA